MSWFEGKSIAVTGAGGSIGSEFCRLALRAGARRLVLISLTESALYNLERRLRVEFPTAELVSALGNVRDGLFMSEVLEGCDAVVHAAAHKHVPICEQNVVEAVLNNVDGTVSAVNAASMARVERFVFISTDKAVRPVSVMGATKRIAELYIREAAAITPKMAIMTVRFGNVADSAGSVIPLWREQIAAGGPITITDKRCTRYFMSIPEACELVAAALGDIGRSGTYVLEMGQPVNIVNLAFRLMAEAGRQVEIVETGLRPGEKLEEQLSDQGLLKATSHPKVLEVENDDRVGLSDLSGLLHAADSRSEKTVLQIMAMLAPPFQRSTS